MTHTPRHPANIETEMLHGKTQSMGIIYNTWTAQDCAEIKALIESIEADEKLYRIHAAAPELLEALHLAYASLDYAVTALEAPDDCQMRETLAKVGAAIAKAEPSTIGE